MTDRRGKRSERGLTLVELMISILLAAILTGGLFYMMSGQSRTYSTQMAELSTQQNLWGAMDYLQRQVRMAAFGFGGCPIADSTKSPVNHTKNQYPAPVVKRWSSALGVHDSVSVGLAVFNNCNVYEYTSKYPPPLSCTSAGGDDSFAVSFAEGGAVGGLPAVRITKDFLAADTTIWVDEPGDIQIGDIVALWEPGTTKVCTAQRITSKVKSGTSWELGVGSDAYNHPLDGDMPAAGYAKSSLAVRLHTKVGGGTAELDTLPLRFAIDRSIDPPRLVQWRKPDRSDREVIADGIEDMQIAWACDIDGNGLYNEGTTAVARQNDEWAHNVASDNVPLCVDKPIGSVRITLIGRSGAADTGNREGFRPAAEDHAKGTPADDLAKGGLGTFRRAKLTVRVRPRNMAQR